MYRIALVLSLVVANSSVLAAQETKPQQQHATGGNEGKHPIGWKVRYDKPQTGAGTDTMSFVQMTPGFHLTTGPAAILYHPDSSASDNYTLESQIFIFPTNGRDREGYGVFIGGRNLDGAEPRYTYFLLRNDGKFMVKQRDGGKTAVVKDWTDLPAIKRATDKDAMPNQFRVAVSATTVTFTVNNVEAVSVPRAQIATDGIFGLRFNHAVNAHVTNVMTKR